MSSYPLSRYARILRSIILSGAMRLIDYGLGLRPAAMISQRKPLIVILGCTGAGKSDLGIAIAKRFGGEVISADSMQIYKGLDIATNKVTEEEMDGIPHHLMSFVEPSTSDYNIHQFQKQAIAIMEKLWAHGKLPIIVGGTAYYVESLIFNENLLPTGTRDFQNDFGELSDQEVYDLLKSIDSESALQIHKNNRFRVVRALQIYYATGRRKSELLKEQHEKLNANRVKQLRYPNLLVFFMDANKAIIEKRLNDRVNRMIERGLRNEIEQFYDRYRYYLHAHGVTQSIAIKEFTEYLKLSSPERRSSLGEKFFKLGCEELKLHTRQYAKSQRRWMKNHLMNGSDPARNVVFLDTTNDFRDTVVPKSFETVAQFLRDVCRTEVSDAIDDQTNNASIKIPLNLEYRKLANQIYHCAVCDIDIQGKITFDAHLKGKKHRRMLRVKKRQQIAPSESESDVCANAQNSETNNAKAIVSRHQRTDDAQTNCT